MGEGATAVVLALDSVIDERRKGTAERRCGTVPESIFVVETGNHATRTCYQVI